MRDHIRNIRAAVRFALSRILIAVDLDGLIPALMLAYGFSQWDRFWIVLGAALFVPYLFGELRRRPGA